MKKGILFLVLFLVMVSAVLAQNQTGCKVTVQSKNTKDLLNEIPSLQTQFQNCPSELPKGMGFIMGTGNIGVRIAMNDGTTEEMQITVKNKKAVGVAKGIALPKYYLDSDEATIDTILNSSNRGSEFLMQYANKNVQVTGARFFTKIKTWFMKPFANWGIKKFLKTQPAPIQKLGKPGDVCQHGGECETGNCIYESGEGPDRTYKCSCDPFKLDTASC